MVLHSMLNVARYVSGLTQYCLDVLRTTNVMTGMVGWSLRYVMMMLH